MATRSIFLAAPNAPDLRAFIDAHVVPVLAAEGRNVVRMPTLGSVDVAVEIMAEIGRCDAMVAIVVGRNPNVFWELGLAFSLGKPLVLVGDGQDDFCLLADVARCVVRGSSDGSMRTDLAAAVTAALAAP